MPEITVNALDADFFEEAVQFVQDNHSRSDAEDGLIEAIFILKRFLKEKEVDRDRPWELLFAIEERVRLLIRIVESGALARHSLRELNHGLLTIDRRIIRAAATISLNGDDTRSEFELAEALLEEASMTFGGK